MDPHRLDRLEEQARKSRERNGRRDDSQVPFEKKDIPALILSALMVFGPIFLVLAAIIVLLVVFVI